MFSVFPEYCQLYFGPHSIDCVTSIWLNGGCIEEGYKNPSNFTTADIVFYNQLSIV